MNTGSVDEQRMLANIHHIAQSLNRIANCMEASELRARKYDAEYGKPKEAVDKAFEYMEASAAAAEERELFGDPPHESLADDV